MGVSKTLQRTKQDQIESGYERLYIGTGCFWCIEAVFGKLVQNESTKTTKDHTYGAAIFSTSVGYMGGDNSQYLTDDKKQYTGGPCYEDICTGQSGQAEVMKLVYDPGKITLREIMKTYWQVHNPTTKNQQGGDRGTQYRSCIYYTNDDQKAIIEETKNNFQKRLNDQYNGRNKEITTEIKPAQGMVYWLAEDYHQQYDFKPGSRSYCGLDPTGVELDIGDGSAPAAGSCPLPPRKGGNL